MSIRRTNGSREEHTLAHTLAHCHNQLFEQPVIKDEKQRVIEAACHHRRKTASYTYEPPVIKDRKQLVV